MDSVSQIALGAAVGVAVMGRRTPFGRAALWGAVLGTLPDLDALIDHGDAVRNMVLHRAQTHAPFYLVLVAPLIAALIAFVHDEARLFRRWWLAVTLVLVTHPLLDVMTIYGTQLGLPFTNHPYGVGSIFIIDPLYTLPPILGVIAALRLQDDRGLRWNLAGIALSCAYLAWGVLWQQQVRETAARQLRAEGVPVERILATPTPFNSLLWRIVAVTPDAYFEGFRSIFDGDAPIGFTRHERRPDLYEALKDHEPVARIAAFSHGFFAMQEREGKVLISDLRMGQAPYFFFTFAVARRDTDDTLHALPPEPQRWRPPTGEGVAWLGRRIFDPKLPAPGSR
ncbi:metal-dependent hydrolase [Sinimarinibacterium thermocellulolyticum]|uniref:Metal-dependent hydrolase n=1 Tax=Sinimarinibacterium thermocellulolyticum TaxID=3170016 RepID=A0ABV2AD59_9GAMM